MFWSNPRPGGAKEAMGFSPSKSKKKIHFVLLLKNLFLGIFAENSQKMPGKFVVVDPT